MALGKKRRPQLALLVLPLAPVSKMDLRNLLSCSEISLQEGVVVEGIRGCHLDSGTNRDTCTTDTCKAWTRVIHAVTEWLTELRA